MIDLAPLRKFEVYGQDAEALMQYAITKDVRKLAIGQVVYSAMCYDNGCMVDDGTLYSVFVRIISDGLVVQMMVESY